MQPKSSQPTWHKVGIIVQKILLVIAITIIGAGVTCGGNLYLANFGNWQGSYGENLFLLWIVEICIVFALGVWFVFFSKPLPEEKVRKISPIVAIFLIIAILIFLYLTGITL